MSLASLLDTLHRVREASHSRDLRLQATSKALDLANEVIALQDKRLAEVEGQLDVLKTELADRREALITMALERDRARAERDALGQNYNRAVREKAEMDAQVEALRVEVARGDHD